MNNDEKDDIDYEHLDDMPLSEHIEWNHSLTEEETKTADSKSIEWLGV